MFVAASDDQRLGVLFVWITPIHVLDGGCRAGSINERALPTERVIRYVANYDAIGIGLREWLAMNKVPRLGTDMPEWIDGADGIQPVNIIELVRRPIAVRIGNSRDVPNVIVFESGQIPGVAPIFPVRFRR